MATVPPGYTASAVPAMVSVVLKLTSTPYISQVLTQQGGTNQ